MAQPDDISSVWLIRHEGNEMREQKLFLLTLMAVVLSFLPMSGCSHGPREIVLEKVAEDLDCPWAIAFAPGGRIFVTERPGHIKVINDGDPQPHLWAEVDVVSPEYRSEGGLLGIAVAQDFETSGHVYVVGTFLADGELFNRVLRFTDRSGKGVDSTVIIDHLIGVRAEPASEQAIHTHLGGALAFGPDGMLYVTVGDVTQPALSQDPGSPAGKILRYKPDGTVPDDNPMEGSPVYALGIRNSQGLAWDPKTGDLFATDHGPSELSWEKSFGGWLGDELNAIIPCGNYGWPNVVGTGPLGRYIDPLVEWSPSIAPSGLAVYTGSRFPWRGNLLVSSLRGQCLWRVEIERDETQRSGWKALRQEALLEGRIGRIRAVAMGPDGHLYIGSSNRDSRGKPRKGDDHLFRVLP